MKNIQILKVIIFTFGLILSLWNLNNNNYYIPFTKYPNINSNKPIGDISKGVKIIQKIEKNTFPKPIQNDIKSNICIAILLANYGNRKNVGQFGIAISVDEKAFKQKINASKIKDNSYYTTCFPGLDNFIIQRSKKINIILYGISSKRGESITAWTTMDTSIGRIINIDGYTNRSLMLRFVTPSNTGIWRKNAIILIILGYVPIIIAFYSYFKILNKK